MIESRRLGSDFRDRFRRAQDRLRDPLLTALTILLMLMLFVIAPLHAAGTIHSQNYGIAMALVLVAGVFIMSGSMLAVIALLVAIGLTIAAALLPFRVDASLDVHLEAIAWVTTGLALIWVVARAVFASGTGHIPPRRRRDSALSDHRSCVRRTFHISRAAQSRHIFRHPRRGRPGAC